MKLIGGGALKSRYGDEVGRTEEDMVTRAAAKATAAIRCRMMQWGAPLASDRDRASSSSKCS